MGFVVVRVGFAWCVDVVMWLGFVVGFCVVRLKNRKNRD